MNRITALKDMGFSLATITEILRSYTDAEALKQYLAIKQSSKAKTITENQLRAFNEIPPMLCCKSSHSLTRKFTEKQEIQT